jgi:hypothetical protein
MSAYAAPDAGVAALAMTQALFSALLVSKAVSTAVLSSALAAAESQLQVTGEANAAAIIAGFRAALYDLDQPPPA